LIDAQPSESLWLREGSLFSKPLVVRVNDHTASAAEVLAVALSIYKRAPIVGEPTVGKAIAQLMIDLNREQLGELSVGGVMAVTWRRLIPPRVNEPSPNNGRDFHRVGLVADVTAFGNVAASNRSLRFADFPQARTLPGPVHGISLPIVELNHLGGSQPRSHDLFTLLGEAGLR
jgi:C-terminal processing protease CtpA/Prc